MVSLEKMLENYIREGSTYREIKEEILRILDQFAEAGKIKLGQDKDLSDEDLEIRTKLIFRDMGFNIEKGRNGAEDFIVRPPEEIEPNEPIILEVKSSRKPHIKREDLRQLDDWVFDLSGEEKARKEGLGGGLDSRALFTRGLSTSKRRHPFPHKGVMIFNGPIGVDFDQRNECINLNDIDFIHKRNFCIIPFAILISYADKCKTDSSMKNIFWGRIHKTTNMLEKP